MDRLFLIAPAAIETPRKSPCGGLSSGDKPFGPPGKGLFESLETPIALPGTYPNGYILSSRLRTALRSSKC